MGVYVRGMEMPTTCRKCGFYHHSVDYGYYDFEYCGANNAEFNNAYDSTKPHINPFEERLRTCPLVPVPPHGRLGDLDKLESGLRHITKYQHGDKQQGILGCCETIRLAPTIIPAEEGET